MPVQALESLLNTREVAASLRVRSETVRAYVATGALPAVRLPGGAMRFRRADVEALTRPVGIEPLTPVANGEAEPD